MKLFTRPCLNSERVFKTFANTHAEAAEAEDHAVHGGREVQGDMRLRQGAGAEQEEQGGAEDHEAGDHGLLGHAAGDECHDRQLRTCYCHW